jgi:hypothetical protein
MLILILKRSSKSLDANQFKCRQSRHLQAYANAIREAVRQAVESDAFKVTISELTHPI